MILKPTAKATNGIIVLMFLALATLVSCSGSDSNDKKTEEATTSSSTTESTAATTTADACSLITEEEAKAILGNAIQKGMTTATMCQYISGSEELSKAGESVSIQLYPNAADQYDAYLASAEKDLNVKPKSVPGVGDKAAFAAGQLIVVSGKDFMVVIVGKNLPEEEQIAAEKTIAQKAIERMGSK